MKTWELVLVEVAVLVLVVLKMKMTKNVTDVAPVVALAVVVRALMVAVPPAQSRLWLAFATRVVMVQTLTQALMTKCERIRSRSDAPESRIRVLVPSEPL